MKKNLSIIIATFNSQKVLPRTLDSIRKQTYPLSRVEILVIDGKSSDNTRKIARAYGCRVIDNPKIVPAWAKYIGYKQASGKYAMYLDSDEVIEDKRSIERKLSILERNSSVRAVTGSGYKSPKGFSFLNQYTNDFGDPFSYFYYRSSTDYRFFIDAMSKNSRIVKDTEDYIIFDFPENHDLPIFELVAMGSIIDLQYFKINFPELLVHPGMIPHTFHLLISKKSRVAITKCDPLIHYSSETLWKYLGKINSRVVNNIYTDATEGFRGREIFSSKLGYYKKYFFFPYAFSVIFPFFDAVDLSLTRENVGYFIHVPLSLYTAFLIMYYMLLKLIGFRPVLRSYGQAKPVQL